MNAKSTPGPWECEEYTDEDKSVDIYKGDRLIATIELRQESRAAFEESAANAELIARAQETAAERDRLKEINAELIKAAELVCSQYRNVRAAEQYPTESSASIEWMEFIIAKAEKEMRGIK